MCRFLRWLPPVANALGSPASYPLAQPRFTRYHSVGVVYVPDTLLGHGLSELAIFLIGLFFALAFVAVAAAELTSATLPPNHHIHDCTLPASQCVYPHLAVGFFPSVPVTM